jgi:hypothetical protein
MVPQMVATRSTDKGGVEGATAEDTCGRVDSEGKRARRGREERERPRTPAAATC